MVQASEFKIIRDEEYHSTLRRDLRRYAVRRWMHRLNTAYEKLIWLPRWKKATRELSKPIMDDKGTRKTLSTCIITMNSADRIQPLLQYVRRFSDEIVVGVDSKTIDNTYKACEGLADELFVIESTALTCNAGLEQLVERCTGDWILRLDDDEFPEPHFEEIKDGLINTEQFTHYKLPRLHLCATKPLEWINDSYLYPDFQMRLFKNDRSLLKFPGAVGHLGIECTGKRGRLNSVNLVHLNMAINPRFKREKKLKTYIERLNGGWVHPVNEYALLYEDFNYNIEHYDYNDDKFCQILTATIEHQRNIHLETNDSVTI